VRVALEQGKQNLARSALDFERELAERRFAPVREALGKRGVALQIDIFTGSLKHKLQAYAADPQVFWIVRAARRRKALSCLLDRITAHFWSLQAAEMASSWWLLRVASRTQTREQGVLEPESRTGLPLA
jgi:hypothetical protein